MKDFDENNKDNRHKFLSGNCKYIYHVGIIDYLQEYNLEKKAENLLKVWVYNREEYRISAVNQKIYRDRFCKFMQDSVLINQKPEDEVQRQTLQMESGLAEQVGRQVLLKSLTDKIGSKSK